MTREEFMQLTDLNQWEWVIKNKELITLIKLDNDSTYVCCDLFKEEGNPECSGSTSMKSYIGNDKGIFHLLFAIGIKCQGV